MKPMHSIAVAALAAALLAAGLSSCVTPEIQVGNPDFAAAKDGIWQGYYDAGLVKVEVEVTAAGGRVESVRIVKHDCGTGKPAEAIVDAIVAKQSLAVDAVSGATHSSRCILKATEIAIRKASE